MRNVRQPIRFPTVEATVAAMMIQRDHGWTRRRKKKKQRESLRITWVQKAITIVVT
jgi:hypothetical protein